MEKEEPRRAAPTLCVFGVLCSSWAPLSATLTLAWAWNHGRQASSASTKAVLQRTSCQWKSKSCVEHGQWLTSEKIFKSHVLPHLA
eukprot:g556.t1